MSFFLLSFFPFSDISCIQKTEHNDNKYIRLIIAYTQDLYKSVLPIIIVMFW